MVICLECGANDLYIFQLLPLPPSSLASVKSRMVYLSGASLPRLSWNTHTQPFYGFVEFVRDNPGEPVPEETFTHFTHHGHQSSLSAFSIYYDTWHPSYSIHVLYSLFLQSLSSFLWSTSWPGPVSLSTLYLELYLVTSHHTSILPFSSPGCPGKRPLKVCVCVCVVLLINF